jgi:acyl-coenzyme A synthetase/AMP-(fatty) acid ligase
VPIHIRWKPGYYRTGDLARYRPDGNIECLGQLDFQVGFRIELDEIDACLAQYPIVKQCVVVTQEDKPGDKLARAYFEPIRIRSRPCI